MFSNKLLYYIANYTLQHSFEKEILKILNFLKKINYTPIKKAKNAYSLPKITTQYRIRRNSLQSNKFRNLFWI